MADCNVVFKSNFLSPMITANVKKFDLCLNFVVAVNGRQSRLIGNCFERVMPVGSIGDGN